MVLARFAIHLWLDIILDKTFNRVLRTSRVFWARGRKDFQAVQNKASVNNSAIDICLAVYVFKPFYPAFSVPLEVSKVSFKNFHPLLCVSGL